MMSDVAGATTSASIAWATARCSMAESMFGSSVPASNMPVMTFSPERAAKVRGRTNSCAACVMTTCTRIPRSWRRRTISAALYAAMPPVTPRATFIEREGEGLMRCQGLWLGICGSTGLEHLAGGLDARFGGFRNDPLYFSCANFILSDAAGLTGTGFDDRRRTTLELAGAASSDKDVTVIAVEAFDQLHTVFSQDRTPSIVLLRGRGEKNPESVARDLAYCGGNIVRLLSEAPGLVP